MYQKWCRADPRCSLDCNHGSRESNKSVGEDGLIANKPMDVERLDQRFPQSFETADGGGSMAQPVVNQPSAILSKRRSRRFPFISSVEATWQEATGKVFREAGQATEVSARGGLLEMRTYPAVGSQIELTSLLSHESSQARIASVRRDSEGRVLGVGVELLVPSETFWGVNFQLKKACADLVKLEYDMRSGTIDARILTEFRDAVDHVRKTAWAVQEWQERQSRHHDPNTVLPLLTAERIRRTSQLCDAITTGLVTHEVTRETVGIDELFQAVERVRQSLLDLLRDREA